MKKKTKRPIDQVRRHPRWGATKAQGERYARERALANRIHELEDKLRTATQPTGVVLTISEMNSLKTLVNLPFAYLADMALLEEARILASLLARSSGLASGKVAA